MLGVWDPEEESTMLSYVDDVAYEPGEEVKTGWAKDPSGEEWTTIIEAADGQFDVYAVRDFGGKTGDVQRAESYSEAEEALEQLAGRRRLGWALPESFGANELNFNAEVSGEVAAFCRGGGAGNFSKRRETSWTTSVPGSSKPRPGRKCPLPGSRQRCQKNSTPTSMLRTSNWCSLRCATRASFSATPRTVEDGNTSRLATGPVRRDHHRQPAARQVLHRTRNRR